MSKNSNSATQSADRDSFLSVNPSTAEGRSRALLFGGLAWLALGHLVDIGMVVWGGIAVVTGAFVLNTAGKLSHYRNLPIPPRNQLALTATWTLLGLSVVGLLVNFAYTRYGPGNGSYFWSLAIAGIGFALLHMAAQSSYLPASEVELDGKDT